MSKSYLLLLLVSLITVCSSCNNNSTPTTSETAYTDTIVYNVLLKPQDEYEAEWLKGLDREALLDSIFASIYYHGAEVYNFADDSKMTLDEVKTMEIEDERYSRDKAAVLQFTEAWRYDVAKATFEKRVISVHIAYEVIDHEGVWIGNRGGFIVRMKN